MSHVRSSRVRRAAACPFRFMPGLEPLETRDLPATFLVANLLDSGPGSLRQAVLDANAAKGADVVGFASELAGTIALASGEMSITDDLAIDGSGASLLTISGNDTSRLFSVPRGVSVSIAGLTLSHGRADTGGAILNDGGILALTNTVVTANRVFGERPFGGAIANLSRAMLTISGSTFSSNEAVGEVAAAGGAIGNDNGSTLVIADSRFTSNRVATSVGAGAAYLQGVALGGAVSNHGGEVVIARCDFTGNVARGGNGADGGPGQPGGNDGFSVGGAIQTRNNLWRPTLQGAGATLTVVDSTFFGNQAVGGYGGRGGEGRAGGNGNLGNAGAVGVIFSEDPVSSFPSTAVITNSTFTANVTLAGRGGDGGAGGNGGESGTGNGGAIVNFRTTGQNLSEGG